MADFVMPSLGADMDAGTILEWRVAPGDVVHRGDVVAVVDTEKSDIDVEVFEDGVVDELLVEVGRQVPVGTPLARIRAGAPAPAAVAAADLAATAAPPPGKPAHVRASPRARRQAANAGLDIAAIRGTGPDGAVTTADIAAPSPPAVTPPRRRRRSPDEGRQRTGDLMARSKREIPHYYLASTMDFGPARRWLDAHNAERPVTERVVPAAVLMKAIALAARDVPEVNGTWEDGCHRPAAAVHLGVAVAQRGGGLLAPAIPDADGRPLVDLMAALADLVERARAGRLRSSETAQATITVTNLGDQGAEEVFGVIHPPQVALVGCGRVVERPWACDGMLTVRPTVRVTLAADHRASTGHEGSRFLAAVERHLTTPEEL